MKKSNYYKNDLKAAKEEFISRLKSIQSSKPVDQLITYLDSNGFFVCPASTKFHGAYEGGLLVHSLLVCDTLLEWKAMYNIPISRDSIIVAALLHDVCKIDDYAKVYRNNQWMWKGVYGNTVKGALAEKLYGKSEARLHGTASVDLIKQFFNLTKQEEEMITWHMGVYTEYYEANPGKFLQWSSDRTNKNINAALLLYFADHLSSMVRED